MPRNGNLKNQKKIIEIQDTVTEIIAFGSLCRLDTAKKRISELKDTSIGTYKTNRKRKRKRISKHCGTIAKGI